jgi:hypothetical protein
VTWVQNICPGCTCTIDANTALDGSGAGPEPGDASVCIRCGSLLTFDAELRIHALADVSTLDPEVRRQLLDAQRLVLAYRMLAGRGEA